mmetsp:Transcript_15564/g.41776  ORF Transcript_15564/g.41776 Transcript_15564/m.41776 type:complete len:262 (-) Transcript_15564:399-1184(-)
MVPPVLWDEEHVPRFQHCLEGLGLSEAREALEIRRTHVDLGLAVVGVVQGEGVELVPVLGRPEQHPLAASELREQILLLVKVRRGHIASLPDEEEIGCELIPAHARCHVGGPAPVKLEEITDQCFAHALHEGGLQVEVLPVLAHPCIVHPERGSLAPRPKGALHELLHGHGELARVRVLGERVTSAVVCLVPVTENTGWRLEDGALHVLAVGLGEVLGRPPPYGGPAQAAAGQDEGLRSCHFLLQGCVRSRPKARQSHFSV